MTQLKRSLDYFLPADAQNREFAISYPRARRYKYEYRVSRAVVLLTGSRYAREPPPDCTCTGAWRESL